MIKKSHPVYTPTSWSGNHSWDRHGNRRNCFINHLLPYAIQGLHRWHWESGQIFSGLTGKLDSLAEVVLQNSRRLGLLTAEKGRLYPFLNEKCCLCVNPSGIARDMAQELRNKQIIKRRAKLANSWGNWNDIWSWALWLLPLTGPLFTLFVALLFGSYILNAITPFITSQIESIKLQMVLVQKSPLNDGELWMSNQNIRWCFLQWVIEALRGRNEEEKLKFSIISFFCLCNSACPLQSVDHVRHVVSESGDLQY